MPKSLSHAVVLTDDFDAVLRFLTEVAGISGVARYEADPEQVSALFGWPVEHAGARGALVGESPGAIDIVEIPESLRGKVEPRVRLLAVANRDVAGAGRAASSAGLAVRGPFRATAATGGPMSLVEVFVGGVAFELVEFG